MTQNINELKNIANRLSVDLIPVSQLASHCLFVNGTNKGRYEDTRLETMTADEFRAIVEEATRQPEIAVLAFVTGPYDNRPRRSIVTGHFLGGDR